VEKYHNPLETEEEYVSFNNDEKMSSALRVLAMCVMIALLFSNFIAVYYDKADDIFSSLLKGEALLTIGHTIFGNKSYSYIFIAKYLFTGSMKL
jgi:hypothetical protein